MTRAAARVAGSYALLVVAVWAPFTLESGMPFETGFPIESESRSTVGAFFYADRLRIYTGVFYQLAYLLGEAVGAGGSFVPYQIVHALLWSGRGLLCFLILERLLPTLRPFHAAVGGLAILHGADNAVNWVGQLNQHGMIFWALASFYALVRACQAATPSARWSGSLAAAGFAHLALWSYESPLVLMCLAALVVAVSGRRHAVGVIRVLAPFLVVLVAYLALNAHRYLLMRGDTYQLRVLRTDWSAVEIAGDLAFNVAGSLAFWRWGTLLPEHAGAAQIAGLAALAAGTFALMLALELGLLGRWGSSPPRLPAPRLAVRLLVAGAVWVAASFPVYLLLEDPRSMWRTQLLSGPGCALLLAAGAALVAQVLREGRARPAAFLLLTTCIAWSGAHAALRAGAWHRHLWERQRAVMAQLVALVPDVDPPVVFALTGIPGDADPWGDQLWLDHALALAYPGREVRGVYFRADGTRGPGAAPDRIDAPRTIAIAYAGGTLRLLALLPEALGVPAARAAEYSPARVIRSGPASARALRRYGVPPPP